MLEKSDKSSMVLKSLALLSGAGVLLFAFQNCGAPLEEELSGNDPSQYENYGPGNPTYNLDGTVSFPLPGSGGSSSSGGGGGSGNINLGGGGSGGGGGNPGGGIGVGGGSGAPDDYIPYTDNFRRSSLYPDPPGGTALFSKHRYYFAAVNRLSNGNLLWNSYRNAIQSWNQQQMGTDERRQLIVISLKKLSESSTSVTYGLTGTSLCYNFSATLTTPAQLTTYLAYWRDEYDVIRGYKASLSAVNITRKSETELTQLESSGCTALAGYDKSALDSFISLFRSYSIMVPDGDGFFLSSDGHHGIFYNRNWLPFNKF